MMEPIYFTTAQGVPMVCVEGDYNGVSNDSLPVVSFWDLRYAFRDIPGTRAMGQFTGGCYYVHTLLSSDPRGIVLCGHEPAWNVDSAACGLVREHLQNTFGR